MQEVHPQPENRPHARYPTDAPEPASVPGAAPAEIWARLPPGAYTRRWVFFRQALRSALLGICALPGRRAARRLLWAAGFALLLGGLAGAMGMLLTGTDTALLPACLGSFVGYLLVLAGLTGTRSAWRIRRQLRRFGGAVLTPTHLHWKDSYGVRGLPQWTLTPDTRPLPNTDSDGPVLLLCPVTLDRNGLCIPLYACTAPAAPETDTAPPVFTDTIDVCVNENGVFFTWDDGISVQQALTAAQCQYYGIESEADLEPLVLRWDVAAFLTRADGQVWAYTTTDQGQTWQAASLTEGASQAEVTDLCLSFTGRGLGFAAVSTQDRESGEIQVGIYTSADGGVSWSAVNTPAPQNDSLRPLNGLIFYDGAAGLASMESGSGSPWPHVFATEDCGQTWEEVAMPFADSGQTSATRLVEFFFDEYDWVAIFTQEPAAPREITFKGSMPSGPWTYAATHASN